MCVHAHGQVISKLAGLITNNQYSLKSHSIRDAPPWTPAPTRPWRCDKPALWRLTAANASTHPVPSYSLVGVPPLHVLGTKQCTQQSKT